MVAGATEDVPVLFGAGVGPRCAGGLAYFTDRCGEWLRGVHSQEKAECLGVGCRGGLLHRQR